MSQPDTSQRLFKPAILRADEPAAVIDAHAVLDEVIELLEEHGVLSFAVGISIGHSPQGDECGAVAKTIILGTTPNLRALISELALNVRAQVQAEVDNEENPPTTR